LLYYKNQIRKVIDELNLFREQGEPEAFLGTVDFVWDGEENTGSITPTNMLFGKYRRGYPQKIGGLSDVTKKLGGFENVFGEPTRNTN
jgi:hypothetical protein